jgi:acyl-CoA thioester hydrolase
MDSPHHRHQLIVPFGDTDASGWMHFPNVFRYVEAAEHEFLKVRGLLVFDRGQGGWPKVHVDCDYKRPLLTGDEIEVQLAVFRVGAAAVTWSFEVWKAGELSSSGSFVTVRVGSDGKPEVIDETTKAILLGA